MMARIFEFLLVLILQFKLTKSDHNGCHFQHLSTLRKVNNHAQMMCLMPAHTLDEGGIADEQCGVTCMCKNKKRYCCSAKLADENCIEVTDECLELILETGQTEDLRCRTTRDRKRRELNGNDAKDVSENNDDMSAVTLPNYPYERPKRAADQSPEQQSRLHAVFEKLIKK